MYNNKLLFLILSVVCLSLLSSSVVLAADTIAKCGTATNVPSLEIPSTNLCSPGIASFVTNHDKYYMWTCYGSNASSASDDAVCSTPMVGKCGNASSTSLNPPINGLCSIGNPVNMNWLSGNYIYRKSIIVSNYADQVLNDYVFTFNVSYATGMQSDFDDIRFVGPDGKTQLSYWIESKVDGSQAIVWIRMPSIPDGASLIYMYYGNSSAISESNGKKVFDFFDDFSASLDTTIWEELYIRNSSIVVSPYTSNGLLKIAGGVATKIRIPSDVVIETMFQMNRNNSFVFPPSLGVLVAGTHKVSRVNISYNNCFYDPYVGSVASDIFLTSSDDRRCPSRAQFENWKRLTTKIDYSKKTVKSALTGSCTVAGNVSSPLKDPFLQVSMMRIESTREAPTIAQVDWIGTRKYYNISTEPFVIFGPTQNVTISNAGPWEWYCLSGDFSTKCSTQVAGVDGKCGTAAKTYAATDKNFVGPFCESGDNIPSNIKFPGVGKTVSWKCSGTGGGKEVTCSANVDILEFDSELVTHTIPASILPEETIKNVTVTMKNTGSITWNKAANIKLGALGDASLFGPSRLELPAGVSVATGQQHVFKFDIKAPKTSKAYNIRYKMVKD